MACEIEGCVRSCDILSTEDRSRKGQKYIFLIDLSVKRKKNPVCSDVESSWAKSCSQPVSFPVPSPLMKPLIQPAKLNNHILSDIIKRMHYLSNR